MADTLPLADRTIAEVGDLLRRREVSSRDLTQACLGRIARDGERLNTFLAVGEETALAAADAVDASEIAKHASAPAAISALLDQAREQAIQIQLGKP